MWHSFSGEVLSLLKIIFRLYSYIFHNGICILCSSIIFLIHVPDSDPQYLPKAFSSVCLILLFALLQTIVLEPSSQNYNLIFNSFAILSLWELFEAPYNIKNLINSNEFKRCSCVALLCFPVNSKYDPQTQFSTHFTAVLCKKFADSFTNHLAYETVVWGV